MNGKTARLTRRMAKLLNTPKRTIRRRWRALPPWEKFAARRHYSRAVRGETFGMILRDPTD